MTRNRRLAFLLTLAMACSASSGCLILNGVVAVILDGSKFFVTTPLIPVSPYFSEMMVLRFCKAAQEVSATNVRCTARGKVRDRLQKSYNDEPSKWIA